MQQFIARMPSLREKVDDATTCLSDRRHGYAPRELDTHRAKKALARRVHHRKKTRLPELRLLQSECARTELAFLIFRVCR